MDMTVVFYPKPLSFTQNINKELSSADICDRLSWVWRYFNLDQKMTIFFYFQGKWNTSEFLFIDNIYSTIENTSIIPEGKFKILGWYGHISLYLMSQYFTFFSLFTPFHMLEVLAVQNMVKMSLHLFSLLVHHWLAGLVGIGLLHIWAVCCAGFAHYFRQYILYCRKWQQQN